MLSVLWLAFGSLLRFFRNGRDLILENFVLQQQLTVLKRRRPRPALNLFDKLFRVAVSRLWSRWKQSSAEGEIRVATEEVTPKVKAAISESCRNRSTIHLRPILSVR
jgi:hypothetical protein